VLAQDGGAASDGVDHVVVTVSARTLAAGAIVPCRQKREPGDPLLNLQPPESE
jgi:hypothetical protein